MKKIIKSLLVLFIAIGLVACQDNSANKSDIKEEETNNDVTRSDTLIVYFSYSGNTKEMATNIEKNLGADTYEIIPTVAYPEEYNECTEVASKEKDENARPEIMNLPDDLSQYKNIIIGYPIWWHTAPMIIGTFLENYDLTGKEIYPFAQSTSMDVDQFEESMEFVRKSSNNGNVHDGLFCDESDTEAIKEYLQSNNLI